MNNLRSITMNKKYVIEIAQFKLKTDVNEMEFLVESEKVTNAFLKKQKGFIDRELIKNNNDEWIDILHWKSMEDALSAAKNIMNDPSTSAFGEMLEPSSIKMEHYNQVSIWK